LKLYVISGHIDVVKMHEAFRRWRLKFSLASKHNLCDYVDEKISMQNEISFCLRPKNKNEAKKEKLTPAAEHFLLARRRKIKEK